MRHFWRTSAAENPSFPRGPAALGDQDRLQHPPATKIASCVPSATEDVSVARQTQSNGAQALNGRASDLSEAVISSDFLELGRDSNLRPSGDEPEEVRSGGSFRVRVGPGPCGPDGRPIPTGATSYVVIRLPLV